MDRRDELFERIFEAHHEYDKATVVIRDMLQGHCEYGSEWEELVARQIASLEKLLALSQELQSHESEAPDRLGGN